MTNSQVIGFLSRQSIVSLANSACLAVSFSINVHADSEGHWNVCMQQSSVKITESPDQESNYTLSTCIDIYRHHENNTFSEHTWINHTRLCLIHSEWCLFMISPSSFKVFRDPLPFFSWTNGFLLQPGKDSDFVRFKVLVFLHLLQKNRAKRVQTLGQFPSSDVLVDRNSKLWIVRDLVFCCWKGRLCQTDSTVGYPNQTVRVSISNFKVIHACMDIVHDNSIQQCYIYSVK